jgi:hypothetical protein
MKPKLIKIGEKSRPVFFGFAALRKFEELSGVNMSDIDSVLVNPSIDTIVKFVYAGLYGGARKKIQPFDFELSDIEDWLDDYGFDKLPELMEVYMSCMPQVEAEGQAPKKGK